MRNVKIIVLTYDYDYGNEETLVTATEDRPWLELTDEQFDRLSTAVKYKYLLGKGDPWYGQNIVLLEDRTHKPIELEAFMSSVEKQLEANKRAEEKRKEAARLKAEAKKTSDLDRKKKQLAKLQAELQLVDGPAVEG